MSEFGFYLNKILNNNDKFVYSQIIINFAPANTNF